ncbi:MAG: ABC transporter ATP-binding protein [Bdellovibrionales bacterium]|nr:ABC transporter ATP-binding protein [Bdellovibrionales bacterium]
MSRSIALESVSRLYHQADVLVKAVSDVSLTFEPGEFTTLFGPSGSGKTTLLNLIGGLDVPTSGQVRIGETVMNVLSPSERATFRLNHIGFIFQSYNLIPVLSARENVEFVMQLQGVHSAARRERAMEVLGRVGLAELSDRRPDQMSGGQQQRVAVARAIASEPDIILADEPTANLDSKTAADLLSLMQELNEVRKITFLFSTHDKQVMERARRLVRLRDGKVENDERRS